MKNVMLVGGGKIGIAITEFLTATGDYRVTVVDRDAASLERMPRKNVQLRHARDRRRARIRPRSRRPRHRSFGDALFADLHRRRSGQARAARITST